MAKLSSTLNWRDSVGSSTTLSLESSVGVSVVGVPDTSAEVTDSVSDSFALTT